MKVALLSLGCKVNQAEFMELEASLKGLGHEVVPLESSPEICVINTCSVTAKSDYQSRQMIRRAASGGARVIVTGCYSELNPGAVKGMNGVIEVIGNRKKTLIINRIDSTISSNESYLSANRARYLLKIQDGCDYSCAYCVIPKARGRSRSIPPESLKDMVKRAVEAGYNEVVLTGIHIGLYGHDLDKKASLYELCEGILKKTALRRLRLGSLEAGELDERFLDLMKDGRLCRHLHVPLQSGDDRILGLMKRPYRFADFMRKVEKFALFYPDLGMGTDVIAGFPGEGDKEFQNTYNLLKEMPFSYLHVFPYSERPGTEASKLPGKVPSEVKKFRSFELRGLSLRKKALFHKQMEGFSADLLLEQKTASGFLGTTGNYIKAHLRAAGQHRLRSIVNVRLKAGPEGYVLAKPVSDE